MANIKFSELETVVSANGIDKFHILQGKTNKLISKDDLFGNYIDFSTLNSTSYYDDPDQFHIIQGGEHKLIRSDELFGGFVNFDGIQETAIINDPDKIHFVQSGEHKFISKFNLINSALAGYVRFDILPSVDVANPTDKIHIIQGGEHKLIEKSDLIQDTDLTGYVNFDTLAATTEKNATDKIHVIQSGVHKLIDRSDFVDPPQDLSWYARKDVMNTFVKSQIPSTTAEVEPIGGVVTWDLTTTQVLRVKLTSDLTTLNISNLDLGKIGMWLRLVIINSTGNITFGPQFKFPSGIPATASVEAGKIDIFDFSIDSVDGLSAHIYNTNQAKSM